jgi:nuclear pore complex protein Nup155
VTNLFSNSSLLSDQSTPAMSSVEADNLCALLSQQCYLYFSIGSRLTFLGFRHAEAALSTTSISKQNEHVTAASNYLREASKHWHNISHVTGQLPGTASHALTGKKQNAYHEYNEFAMRALENGSPLARAASVLMGVNDVAGFVDVCLTCARNFDYGSFTTTDDLSATSELLAGSMLPWERTLYHRHLNEATDDLKSGVVTSRDNNASTSKEASSVAKRTCYGLLYYHLDQLMESVAELPQNSTLVERMISIATSSPDIAFIHGLYEYLASSGHVDTLLRIDSSSFERWLQSKNDYHLLWRYYTVHNIHWMAGEVMWNRGISIADKVILEERIECLTRAMSSYSVALRDLNHDSALLQNRIASRTSSSGDLLSQRYGVSPSRDEVNRVLSQLNEQIDVAKIQTRILSTIMSSSNAKNIDEDQTAALRTTFMDISKLYNDFAAPLGLYDICLAILQTCKHDDSPTITKLWRSILCEELLPCRTKSKVVQGFLTNLQRDSMLEEESVIFSHTSVTKENGEPLMSFEDGDWITNIKSRVIALGKELHGKGTDFVFPLRFIAECLEGLRRIFNESTVNTSDHWTIKVLVESGAPFTSILEAYHSIFSSQSDNSNAALKLQELSNIGEVLKLWVSLAKSSTSGSPNTVSVNVSNGNKTQLARYSNGILAQIDRYKAELESLVGCNSEEVSRCYALFNDIEKILRRGW